MSAESFELVVNRSPDIDALVCDLRQLYCSTGLELFTNIGHLILERLYEGNVDAWHSRGPKDTSFRKLERHPDLPFAASTLSKTVSVYLMSLRRPDLLELENIGLSHFQELVGLEPTLQDHLIACASQECWTVRRLRAEVRLLTTTRQTAQGRPRVPSFVRCLRGMRNSLNERQLLADIDEVERLKRVEVEDLLVTARRLCEQAEIVVRQLAKHLRETDDKQGHGTADDSRQAGEQRTSGVVKGVSTSKHESPAPLAPPESVR